MSGAAVVRVTGTDDTVEIAAALTAVLSARGGGTPTVTPYERWRRLRVAALRRDRHPRLGR